MLMHNPPHPGEVVREELLGFSVTESAQGLGLSRTALSELLNDLQGIPPEKAIRLSPAFGGNGESQITQQTRYGPWRAMRGADKIKRQGLVVCLNGVPRNESRRCI